MKQTAVHTPLFYCLFVVGICVSWTIRAATIEEDVKALEKLKPSEIVTELKLKFPGYVKQHEDKLFQYEVVKRYLSSYIQGVGTNYSSRDLGVILDQVQTDENLMALVLYWLHEARVLGKLDDKDRSKMYEILVEVVKRAKGEAFQAGIGLLRRSLEGGETRDLGQGVNKQDERQAIAARRAEKILELAKNYFSQDVSAINMDVAKSVLEEVGNFSRKGLVASPIYVDFLKTSITNHLFDGKIRTRSASLLLQEKSSDPDVIRLLKIEVERKENDDTVKRELSLLIDKQQKGSKGIPKP